MNTTAIEEESDRVGGFALSLTKGIHEFLQGCGALDLEEDLIVVVGDLDVEMFADGGTFRLLRRTGASVLIRSRHLGGKVRASCVFSEIVRVRLSRS